MNRCINAVIYSCPEEMKKMNMPQYAQKVLEGAVIGCLREKYRESVHSHIELSVPCKQEVRYLRLTARHMLLSLYFISKRVNLFKITKAIVDAEFDPQLDLPLYHACQETIKAHCSSTIIQKVDSKFVLSIHKSGESLEWSF